MNSTEEMIVTVAKTYARNFDGIDADDLAQEIRLHVYHGKATSYDESIGDFAPYARAIANRTAHAYVYAQRCPVHGRMANLKRWKGMYAVSIDANTQKESSNKRRETHEPHAHEEGIDELIWSRDVVDCIQAIFDAYKEDGRLARQILLEQKSAEDVARKNNLPTWRVYRATFRLRRAIKANPQARLLWETR